MKFLLLGLFALLLLAAPLPAFAAETDGFLITAKPAELDEDQLAEVCKCMDFETCICPTGTCVCNGPAGSAPEAPAEEISSETLALFKIDGERPKRAKKKKAKPKAKAVAASNVIQEVSPGTYYYEYAIPGGRRSVTYSYSYGSTRSSCPGGFCR